MRVRSDGRSDAANAEYADLLARERRVVERLRVLRASLSEKFDVETQTRLESLETELRILTEHLRRCEALIKYDFKSGKPYE
jgi:hypothetical protein